MNTITNYTSPLVTEQVTNNIINTTSGNLVQEGRIARHWKDVPLNVKRYFRDYTPKYLNKNHYNDTAAFVEHYKLRSIEFGNWTNQKERREFLIAAADSLDCIAQYFKVSPEKVGLNRKLSISYGARGIGGSMQAIAHYECLPYAIINITKPYSDEGCFLHEYTHALDNLIAYHILKNDAYTMISNSYEPFYKSNNKYENIIYDILDNILYIDDKKHKTKFHQYLKDNELKYELRTEELIARSFEAIYIDKFKDDNNKLLIKKANNYNIEIYPSQELLKPVLNSAVKFFTMAINDLYNINTHNPVKIPIEEPKKENLSLMNLQILHNKILNKHPNHLTFIKYDNTYYSFGSNAVQISKLLGQDYIAIDNVNKDNYTSLTSIPKYKIDKAIKELQEFGFNIAIAENENNIELINPSKKTEKEKKDTKINTIKKVEKEKKDIKIDTIKKVEEEENKELKDINIIYGNDVEITTPTEDLNAKYGICDLFDLIPSNDPFTFSKNENYPPNCQTRDYRMVQGEQIKVKDYSKHFKADHLLNTSPDATTGTPIITKDGIVLGGNGRTMILYNIVANYKENYKSYLNLLKRGSDFLFGIEPSKYEHIKHPIAVRVIEKATINECSKYSNILNQSNSQAYDEYQEGISIAKQLIEIPNVYENIAYAISELDVETVPQMFSNKEVNKLIIDTLKNINFINKTNGDLYVTNDYEFTTRGQIIITNALLSSILPSKQLLIEAKEYRNKILSALPYWIIINSLSNEFNLVPHLQKALLADARRKRQKLSMQEFIVQGSTFGEEVDVITIEILKILDMRLKYFKSFSKFIAKQGQISENENMFGDKSNPIDIIIYWQENKEDIINMQKEATIQLNDIIEFSDNRKKAINYQANFLFYPIPTVVTFVDNFINIYNKDNGIQLGQIDLEIMKVNHNQLDVFGITNFEENSSKMNALFGYVKAIIKKQYKPIPKTEKLFQIERQEKEIIPQYVPRNQYRMFSNKIQTENLEDIYNDSIEIEDINSGINNLNELKNIALKPLRLTGKSKKMLYKLNSPFQMLIWGVQGSGKSSFLLTMLDELSINGNCLLILTEEKARHGRISARANRMKIQNLNKIDIAEVTKIHQLVDLIDTGKYKFIAIDSKDMFEDEKHLINIFSKYEDKDINFIVISHSVKNGVVNTGDRRYAYLCNTEIFVSDDGVATTIKHRDAVKGNSIPIFTSLPRTNNFLNI